MSANCNEVPPTPPRIREREVETYLADRVRRFGGLSLKLLPLHFAGLPDRLVILPGGLILFVEVKAPGGKLSALQKIAHNRLDTLGCNVYTVTGFAGVDWLFNNLFPDD